MIPEGIVELPAGPWTSNSVVQLISDNGITVYYDDAIEAKQLTTPEFKKFRADWITLGPVVKPSPIIKSFGLTGPNCALQWYSMSGTNYRVQWKAALPDALWNDVPGDVTATDALAGKLIPMAGVTQRFFRVIIP
jgi:hypothetical protein